MDFSAAFARGDRFLMEGALGERLKREYNLTPYPHVALAGFLTTPAGRKALGALWLEYAQIAHRHGFPFLATTPTRRANRSRVAQEGLGEGLLRESVCFLRQVLEETEGPAWLGVWWAAVEMPIRERAPCLRRRPFPFTVGRQICWPKVGRIFCMEHFYLRCQRQRAWHRPWRGRGCPIFSVSPLRKPAASSTAHPLPQP